MKKVIIFFIISIFILVALVLSINYTVILSTKNQIYKIDKLSNKEIYDCIIILGAGVKNGQPTPMLKDRLDEGISLYKKGLAPKIIVSGDHGRKEYDEVNIMKEYIINAGIPSEDIFMDHAGFSTYDTIYRAKKIFEVKKAILVTQKYHLYRSLYIANSLGINSIGVGADPQKYTNQLYRELREILARNKDLVKCIFKPAPTYLGESIPVNGDGNITNDKEE